MLPSMPVLFNRESQDAFGNKIQPSTSFFNQNLVAKPPIKPEPPPIAVVTKEPIKLPQKETKSKGNAKKKEEPPKLDNNVLETAFVKSYYTKVQSRFSTNPSATNKFFQFQNILKSFDPSKESPVELYKKFEQLFGEGHKDILEDFLLFLKPGQAAEVGRFMDHFMMGRINSFIQLLHSTFNRKPTVLRKILRALTTAINSGSKEEIKTRVLPHLRSNPRLSQLFKSLFPDECIPDSVHVTDADTIHESFLTSDKGYDVWEFQEETDNKKKLDVTESLDTMYLHGRVFLQHGRLLRSASVTYPYSKEPYRVHLSRLAPAHCHLSPPESEDERASPKRSNKNTPKAPPKKSKKQLKSPTKNVKDVNDNTKLKDCTAPSALNSPKTPKSKAQNNKKTCKDKKDDTSAKDGHKRERKESKSSNCQKKDEAPKAKQAKIEPPIKLEVKNVQFRSTNWTRDEDKTMLQVIKVETDTELVFGRIQELLPHRSVTEIKERFCHVMTLLQQMAVGEVT